MATSTDTDLWARSRAGDAASFGELYERHARSVQAYCLWQTADPHLAEDATATAFLEAWRRRRRLELTTPSAAPLLLGIATNVIRNHRRGRRRHLRALERIRRTDPIASAPPDEEVLARIDALDRVRDSGAAIRALPQREREVLALLAWGELSYAETAAALGIPLGTVRSRASRARARLGDAFSDLPSTPTAMEDPIP